MLKIDSEMFHNLNEEAIKDNKKDVFVDAFTEFITELDDIDLSEKTKQHLYDIFIKDMNIYFEIKKYEKDYIPKSKVEEKIKEVNEEFDKRNTPDNNEWYIDSEICTYATQSLQELLEE